MLTPDGLVSERGGNGNANSCHVTSGRSGTSSPVAMSVSPKSSGFHGSKQPFRGQGN